MYYARVIKLYVISNANGWFSLKRRNIALPDHMKNGA